MKKWLDNQLDRRRLMRNKVTKIIAIVIILIFGGTYMYNKLTKPNLGPKQPNSINMAFVC